MEGHTVPIRVMFYDHSYDQDRRIEGEGCMARKFRNCGSWYFRRISGSRVVSFQHVEMMIDDRWVTSVTEKGGCHLDETRVLSNPGYETLLISLRPAQARRMLEFAQRNKECITFNRTGYYLNFLPVVGRISPCMAKKDSFFCSQYIVRLLNEAGKLKDVRGEYMDPTTLYDLLRERLGAIVAPNIKKEAKLRERGERLTPKEIATRLLMGDLA